MSGPKFNFFKFFKNDNKKIVLYLIINLITKIFYL